MLPLIRSHACVLKTVRFSLHLLFDLCLYFDTSAPDMTTVAVVVKKTRGEGSQSPLRLIRPLLCRKGCVRISKGSSSTHTQGFPMSAWSQSVREYILSLHPLKVNGLFFFSSYVPVPTILFLPSFVFDNCEVFFFF